MPSSLSKRIVRALLAVGTGHGAYVHASLFDVVRELKASDDGTHNTAQLLSACLKVFAGRDGPFVYDSASVTLSVHVLDRACLSLARAVCGGRVRRALHVLVQRVHARRVEGRFFAPSARRSGVAVEIRRRMGGVKDGKLDWYLVVDGVAGKPIRSFPEIETRV